MPTTVHRLKTWPGPFNAVWNGDKRFEIRKNDRDFKVGDLLDLQEWDPVTQSRPKDARFVLAFVTYMVNGGEWGLPEGLCVMGLGPPQQGWERNYESQRQSKSQDMKKEG